MNKNRTWTLEQLELAIKDSFSIRAVIAKLGLVPAGGNYKQLKKYIEEYNLDISHFTGQGHLKNKTHNWAKVRPLSEILATGVYYSSHKLKERLVKGGYKKYQCDICGISQWNASKISLHLDHINGINTDNRLENLRILCPNCHSQTDTYCRQKQNAHKVDKIGMQKNKHINIVCSCGKEKTYKAKCCLDCSKKRRSKIIWPSVSELETMIQTNSHLAVGRMLGVSDNAVRKYLRKHKVSNPF